MKRIPPEDFDAQRAEPQTPDDLLAREAAAVIVALAARFTSWRRELGFEGERQ